MNITLETSKSGLPCLWLAGGACRNSGEARVIANADGTPKNPLYVRKNGELSNSRHALVVVAVGDFVLDYYYGQGDEVGKIYKIKAINGDTAETETVVDYCNGTAKGNLPKCLGEAFDAVIAYAREYHCRRAYFIA